MIFSDFAEENVNGNNGINTDFINDPQFSDLFAEDRKELERCRRKIGRAHL